MPTLRVVGIPDRQATVVPPWTKIRLRKSSTTSGGEAAGQGSRSTSEMCVCTSNTKGSWRNICRAWPMSSIARGSTSYPAASTGPGPGPGAPPPPPAQAGSCASVNSQAAVPQALSANCRRPTPSRRCFSSTSDRHSASRRAASSVGGNGQYSPFEGGSKSTGGRIGNSASLFFMRPSRASIPPCGGPTAPLTPLSRPSPADGGGQTGR